MSAPVKVNHSTNDKIHDDKSPVSSIIGLIMLLSVLVVVCFMFKDQIKSWLHKDKKILQKSDDATSFDSSDAEPKANDGDEPKTNSKVEFEIEQPQLEDKS